jgi:hypothetical protein
VSVPFTMMSPMNTPGSRFSSLAVEATIDELFIDAENLGSPTFEGADSRTPRLLAEGSWDEIERKPTLCKYQTAPTLAEKQEFNRGVPPYREADDLIQLRNALVHYKPEWDRDQKKHRKIADRLKSRFPQNPFAGSNDVFFPKKCLGYGFAEWVVESGVTFIESLFRQLGLPSIFRNYCELGNCRSRTRVNRDSV